jgi:hypothetical protein
MTPAPGEQAGPLRTITAPTAQFLAWVAEQPRRYAETIEVWQTSCPRLAVWEDALAEGLVLADHGSIELTAAGRSALADQA